MGDLAKKPSQTRHESYRPKKPEILNMAEEVMDKVQNDMEILVSTVDDYCSIVDRKEIRIVGIKVEVNPYVDLNATKIVEKIIKEGTCGLLESIVGNKNKGHYVAAASNIKTGVEFTYVIGVEVDSFEDLPSVLPSNTVTFTVPAARYAKEVRVLGSDDQRHSNSLQAICYLGSRQFRRASGYTYDKRSVPFRVFDSMSELVLAYEPVKIPVNDEEKFEQVNYEVVVLPELKVAGMSGNNGGEAMMSLFGVWNNVDWKTAGCLNMKQLYSFRFTDKDGNKKEIFGRVMADLNNVPKPLCSAVVESGLWVKFSQMQINNDDPSIYFEGCKEVLFFNKHPEYVEDNTRSMLYVAQFEQGACCYFPIKKALN